MHLHWQSLRELERSLRAPHSVTHTGDTSPPGLRPLGTQENTLPGRSKKALEEAVARACEALETQVKYSGCCGFGAPPESAPGVRRRIRRCAPCLASPRSHPQPSRRCDPCAPGGTTVCAVFIRTAPPGAYPDLGGGQAPLQVVTENIGDSRAVMFPLPKARPQTTCTRSAAAPLSSRVSLHSRPDRPSSASSVQEQGVMGQRSPQSGAAATAAATAGASESTGSTSKPRKREASQSAKAMAEVYRCGLADVCGLQLPTCFLSRALWYYCSSWVRPPLQLRHSLTHARASAAVRCFPPDRIDTAASTLDPSVALSGEGPFPPPAPEALALGVALTRDHRAETNAEEVVRVKSAGCAFVKGNNPPAK